jgi:hypothetical protein
MTTMPNPPNTGSGNTGGPTLVDGRLSDLAMSVHDPAVDLVLPVLRYQEWAEADASEEIMRAVVALQSYRLANSTAKGNQQGEAKQRSASRTAVDRLKEAFPAGDDETLSRPDLLVTAQAAAAAVAEKVARSELVRTLDEGAGVARFLHNRFVTANLNGTVDLRAPWLRIRDQGSAAGCVGFAVADLLQLQGNERLSVPSARFIWQAAKEVDGEERPTTMIAGAGTSLRAGLQVVQEYGYALESEIPSDGNALYNSSLSAFYKLIGTRRIHRFINLGNDVKHRLAWLSLGRPIVCAMQVGRKFLNAAGADVVIEPDDPRSGDCFSHAVVIVGYRVAPGFRRVQDVIEELDKRDASSRPNDPQVRAYDELPLQYLIRNNAGPKWGDQGYAWVRHVDFFRLFLEEYGIFCDENELRRTTTMWEARGRYAPLPKGNGKREAPSAV